MLVQTFGVATARLERCRGSLQHAVRRQSTPAGAASTRPTPSASIIETLIHLAQGMVRIRSTVQSWTIVYSLASLWPEGLQSLGSALYYTQKHHCIHAYHEQGQYCALVYIRSRSYIYIANLGSTIALCRLPSYLFQPTRAGAANVPFALTHRSPFTLSNVPMISIICPGSDFFVISFCGESHESHVLTGSASGSGVRLV